MARSNMRNDLAWNLDPCQTCRHANTDSNLPVAQELKKWIRQEQVALLYRNSNIGFVVSIATGALLVLRSEAHVSIERLMSWYGLLLLVTVARYFLTQNYQQSVSGKPRAQNWEMLFLLGASAAGFVWGLSIIILFPHQSVAHQFFIALVLAGMVGGSVAVFSARKTVYYRICLHHPDPCHSAFSV